MVRTMSVRTRALFGTLLIGLFLIALSWSQAKPKELKGQVVKADGTPVGSTNIRFAGFANERATTPQGDFVLPIPPDLGPGYPVTLAVTDWEMRAQYQAGVPGGMFLPYQVFVTVRVVVAPKSAVALDQTVIRNIVEQYGYSLVLLGDAPATLEQRAFTQFLAAQA